MKEINGQPFALPEPKDLDKPKAASPAHTLAAYTGYSDIEGADENHFREYLRPVRKHMWLIIGLALIATAAAAVYVAQKPDIYTAQTRVQVDLESNPGAGTTKNGTLVINGLQNDPAHFNTH